MWRGAVKSKMRDESGAIADERTAVKLAKSTGDPQTLQQAIAQLKCLKGPH